MNVEKTIKSLLYHYDCVIVPNFGGFVAKQKSAVFNPIDYTFNPPRKVVGFNSDLVHSDGLLANELAKKSSIDYSEAQEHIENIVADWKNTLNENKTIVFKDLGTFSKTNYGIEFFPSENQNFDFDTFGLDSIKGNYILRNQVEETPENSSTTWASYAASIVFALMIGASGFFANQEIVQPQLSSVLPMLSANKIIVEKPVVPIAPVIDINKVEINPTQNISEELSLDASNDVATENQIQETTTLTQAPFDKAIIENTMDLSVKKYQVIGGSFKVYARAIEHQAKLKRQGHERAVIVGKVGNFFMVAFDTFHDEHEAIAYKKEIQKMGYDVFMRP